MSMKMRVYADDVTVAAELPSVPSRPSTRTQQRQLKLAREKSNNTFEHCAGHYAKVQEAE